jgi:hypothetical protein
MKTAVVLAVLFGATVAAQAPPTGRAAVIAGRVIDDLGDPVIAAHVTVERPTAAGGATAVATADTDDRGEYRVPGLSAGSFVVAVRTIGGIRTETIGTQVVWSPDGHKTYFPGVGSAAEASTVTLQPSEERADINLVVPAAQATTQPFSIAGGGGATAIVMSPFAASVPRLGTGVIRGRVVATDGRPLARAQVGLVLAGMPRPTQDVTRADSAGAFEFRGLSPGTYRIVASKPGYEPIVADAPPLGLRILYSGRSITVTASGAVDPVDVPLAPLATLSGVVLDDNGDPLQGASVQLLTVRYEAGRRQLVSADVASRVTDDLGRYRLFGLAPGPYVVNASIGSVSSADVSGFVRSYFPATSNPSSAQFVAVRRSEAVSGIDISMVRGRTARVTGRILDAAGQPTTGGTVMLRPRQRASIVGVSVGARLLPDGRFEFPNVPPGDFVIQANRGRTNPSSEGEFGALPITVNGTDVSDLMLAMSIGSTVSGSIRFETLSPDTRPAPSTVEVSSIPVDFDLAPWNGFATADVRAEGQFQMTGLHGPRRLRVDRVPPGWALKEILVNGIDATDRPITFGSRDASLAGVDVVLTDRVSSVSGTVVDADGKLVDGASVVVFAADRDRWYPASRFFSTALTGLEGMFALTGLPAGAYYLTALSRLPADNAWQEPAFLDELRRDAGVITIAEGRRSSITLHLLIR